MYRAWDTRLDREVALKLLPESPESEIHSKIPTEETEQPGMGKAIGPDLTALNDKSPAAMLVAIPNTASTTSNSMRVKPRFT